MRLPLESRYLITGVNTIKILGGTVPSAAKTSQLHRLLVTQLVREP